MSAEDLVVCLGFAGFHGDRFVEQLAALDGVEPVVLPIDPGADWSRTDQSIPHEEPPPWGIQCASERRDALERMHVFVALQSPANLATHAPRLRWIQGIGAGVEQFVQPGISKDRVVVTNAAGVSAASMAEWTIGRLLQVWKRFREADDLQRRRAYERTYGRTFAGSTIGVVGLGHIGRAVSERARAFGCRVIGLKRSARPGDRSEHADELFPPERLHELLAASDAVVVSAPATPETRHLIDAEALAAMKPNAVLVNVARGSLLDEAALATCMREQGIAAAILDVFDPEPLPEDSPLWDLPGVYISAHSSVSVDRYMDDVFEIVLENVERYRAGEPLRNLVDMGALGFEAPS